MLPNLLLDGRSLGKRVRGAFDREQSVMTPTPDDIRKATQLACILSANFDRHVQQIATALRAEREAERERCRKLAVEAVKRLPEEQRANGDFCHEAIDQAIRRSEP